MENIELKAFLRFMKAKLGMIILFGLIIALFSFYAFIFTQKRYQVKTDFLITQNQENNQDFYTSAKAIEYLDGVITESIYSTIFINELKNDDRVDVLYFPADERAALEKWEDTIKVEQSANLGMIKIKVFDDDKENALAISQGAADIIVNKNQIFGGKNDTQIKVLSGPIIEKNPDMTSIMLVVLGGFLIGALMQSLYIYLKFVNSVLKVQEDEEYLRSLREIR